VIAFPSTASQKDLGGELLKKKGEKKNGRKEKCEECSSGIQLLRLFVSACAWQMVPVLLRPPTLPPFTHVSCRGALEHLPKSLCCVFAGVAGSMRRSLALVGKTTRIGRSLALVTKKMSLK
jgi:hypothetical protein